MLRTYSLRLVLLGLLLLSSGSCAESQRFGLLPAHAGTFLLGLAGDYAGTDLDGGVEPHGFSVQGLVLEVGPQDASYEGTIRLTWGSRTATARYVGVERKLVLASPRPWLVRESREGDCDLDFDLVTRAVLESLELSFSDRDGDGIAESVAGTAQGEMVRLDGRLRVSGRLSVTDVSVSSPPSVSVFVQARTVGQVGSVMAPILVSLSPPPAPGTQVALRVADEVVPLEPRPERSSLDSRWYELTVPPLRWDAAVIVADDPTFVDVFGRRYEVPGPIFTPSVPPTLLDGGFETNAPAMPEIVSSYRGIPALHGLRSMIVDWRSEGVRFLLQVPPGATRLVFDTRFVVDGFVRPSRPSLAVGLRRGDAIRSAAVGPDHDVTYPLPDGQLGDVADSWFTDVLTLGMPLPPGMGTELVVELGVTAPSVPACGVSPVDPDFVGVGAYLDDLRFE